MYFTIVGSSASLDVTDSVGGAAAHGHLQTVDLTQMVEMAPNRKRMASCSLKSRINLRRLDSGSRNDAVLEREIDPVDFRLCLKQCDVTLQPGANNVTVCGKVRFFLLLAEEHLSL